MQNEVTVVQNKLTALISSEKFFKVYSPANCVAHSYKLKTIADALDRPTPSLNAVKRDYGAEACDKFVMAWLIYLNEMLNLSRPMSEEQIRLCSSQIMNDYGYLKLTELSFIFKRILSGEYGEFYERLGIDKLLTFFRQYDKERFTFIDEQRQREHSEFRYQEQTRETPMEAFKRRAKKALRLF